MKKQIARIQDLLNKTKKICVLTGAGVSAESGIPTFRGGGKSAVWKGMPFEQISSARMVHEDLDAVWEWFDYRRGLYQDCLPNAAHSALVNWETRFKEFTLVTQNVDGLHERAGSRNVIELHGNINHSKCTGCERLYRMSALDLPHKPIVCKDCDAKLRPDVVLFGEMLPVGAFEKASQRAAKCEMFFLIGTSAIVYPAASLPEIAKANGAFLVEINPESTPLSAICDESIQGMAGEILPSL